MHSNALTVGAGVELAYTDSGAPSSSPYTTIFAVHGVVFTNCMYLVPINSRVCIADAPLTVIFKKVQAVAPSKGFRFVALSRRGFPGSTPYTQEERNTITDSKVSPENRYAFMQARGNEIATFIDMFISKFDLPPVSSDKKGGSILLGWSQGSQYASAAIAFAPSLASDVRARISAHIHTVMLYGKLSIHRMSPRLFDGIYEQNHLQ